MATLRSDTRSISIQAVPRKVFDLLADVSQWPRWSRFAQGGVSQRDGHWLIHSPQGDVVLFEQFNAELGLLDHIVEPRAGLRLFIPMRVVPNAEGAELMLTIFQPSGLSETLYQEQLAWVVHELRSIKALAEAPGN